MTDLFHEPRPARNLAEALREPFGEFGWLIGSILGPIGTAIKWFAIVMAAILMTWMGLQTIYFFAVAILRNFT